MIGLVFSLAFTMISVMIQLTVWTVRIMFMILAATVQLISAISANRRH